MKQTVVGIFDSALRANEALRVLVKARFDAERLPRIPDFPSPIRRPAQMRLWDTLVRRVRDFMDADMYLQPYASAMAKGRFVVKVYALDESARDLWRLQPLRRWSHEQVEQVLT